MYSHVLPCSAMYSHGMVRVEGIWYPWGGPPLIFLLLMKPLT